MILTFLHDTLWVMDDERTKEITQRERGLRPLVGTTDSRPSADDFENNWMHLSLPISYVLMRLERNRNNLSETVLNRLGKKAREASGEHASRANMLKPQLRREGTQGGNVASNSNEGGGVDTGCKVFGVAPEAIPQHAPDTDERNGRKDPTCQWSVDW